jgi:hypothetical protein
MDEYGLRDLGLRSVGVLSCEQWCPLPPRAVITKLYPIFLICRTYSPPVVVHAHAGGGAKNIDYCNPARCSSRDPRLSASTSDPKSHRRRTEGFAPRR